MGRQRPNTRQARRAQERRQASGAHGLKSRQGGPQWAIIVGAAVIAAAILLVAGATAFGWGKSGSAIATPTIPPGPSVAGIGCDQGMTGPSAHIHAHLEVDVKGKLQPIGSDYGHDYNHDCLFWVHAHDTVGIIHMESPSTIHPTLMTWRTIALRTLPASSVPTLAPMQGLTMKVWVNQKPYQGDPRQIKLYQHTDIRVEYGPPFTTPTPFNFKAHQV